MSTDLILALDVPTREEAAPLLRQLRGSLNWVKIGLQMFTAHGPDYVRAVADEGFNVFLDLKLHDIPNTVAKAVESLAPLPIGMLTLHTCGGREMMVAAQKAAAQTKPGLLLLGVTVLTSTNAAGLAETGVNAAPESQVLRLAKLATDAGLRGLVCSPLEVPVLRRELPAHMQLVTPGIRSAAAAGTDDQKRTMTPAEAARAGSSFIVVGRPILKAPDPAAAARAIMEELGQRHNQTQANDG
ncbi:orotidine-5'-phosphate decarboxylase [Ereboglobus sp. PH5-5]|uniref:Orotidine 5'-phosphate decarboxylase n=1 Tax=Ereboglobus luteus TaxID=1796921 RepID=A0A2U8E6U6_9BACT|nr:MULTISPECIES: orotidine-5'-phosphate decarboxylase [Ereboglobus]AWI10658.1 orotidine-5'-phosphate decarboxylase [Ereboglobus luteus]MDF9832988.1 orotidine-5'-phosphate decarboxylase [Ereboglobus sp. PH5-5]